MKNFDDFWKDTIDSGLIPRTHPNLSEIEYAARLGFMAAIALQASEKEEGKQRHLDRMANDPAYAEKMKLIMFEKGSKFTIALECIKPDDNPEIFTSLFSRVNTPEEHLIAGCRVYRIDNHDPVGRVDVVKSKLLELVNHLNDGTI